MTITVLCQSFTPSELFVALHHHLVNDIKTHVSIIQISHALTFVDDLGSVTMATFIFHILTCRVT